MSSPHNEDRFSDDLQEVADVLRDQRPALTPLQLDQIKLRAMSGASRSTSTTRNRGSFMKSRLTTLIAAAFLALGTGGTLALAGGGGSGGKNGGGSASFNQYHCEHGKSCEEGKGKGKEKEKTKGHHGGGNKGGHKGDHGGHKGGHGGNKGGKGHHR